MRRAGWRSVAAAVLAAALLAPLGPGARPAAAGEAGEAPSSFSDVPPDHPFASAIAWLADAEITTGFSDGSYQPGGAVTRQAMAAFLYRFDQAASAPGEPTSFPDVPGGHPFVDEVGWLSASGITTGYADGTFGPGRVITRQAMAAFLWRWSGTPEPAAPAVAFTDVPDDHPFAPAIAWLSSSGITTGFSDGTFRPAGVITRQAMAAFLWRAAGEPALGEPGANRVDPAVVSIIDGDEVAEVVYAGSGGAASAVRFDQGADLPAVGDLVVLDATTTAPEGALGRVAGVDGSSATVSLQAAAADEIVEVASLASSTPVPDVSAVASAVEGALADAGCDLGVSIQVDPAIDLRSVLELEWGAGGPEFFAGFVGEAGLSGRVTAGGTIGCDRTVTLAGPIRLPPVPVPGPLPPIFPEATTILRVSVAAGTGAGVDFDVSIGGRLGAQVAGDVIQPVADLVPSASVQPVSQQWDSGNASVFVGERVDARLGGALGLFVEAGGVAALAVAPSDDPWLEVVVAGEVSAGANINVFLRDRDFQLARVRVAAQAVASFHPPRPPALLPPGQVGEAYSAQLTSSTGSAPFTWALAGGQLPDGIALAADGRLTGTPSSVGSSSITVRVTDRYGISGTAALLLPVFGSGGGTGSLTLVSADAAGQPADGGDSTQASISADGRFVAFTSNAAVVPGVGASLVRRVYVRDLVEGTTELVSKSTDGAIATATSSAPSISGDGKFVVFATTARLAPGDTGSFADVYIHNRDSGRTTLVPPVSVSSVAGNPVISDDGKFVVFESHVPGNGRDVFIYERQTGDLGAITVSGAGGGGASVDPDLSSDGSAVVFASTATDLVPGDTNGDRDVFLWDQGSEEITRVSVAPNGEEVDFDIGPRTPTVSADGSHVAYATQSLEGLLPEPSNNSDVLLWNRATGGVVRVTPRPPDFPVLAVAPAIDAGGDHVAFIQNSVVQHWTRQGAMTTTVTGVPGSAEEPAISGDGRHVAFNAHTSVLLPNDQVYVWDRFG